MSKPKPKPGTNARPYRPEMLEEFIDLQLPSKMHAVPEEVQEQLVQELLRFAELRIRSEVKSRFWMRLPVRWGVPALLEEFAPAPRNPALLEQQDDGLDDYRKLYAQIMAFVDTWWPPHPRDIAPPGKR